MQDQLHALVLGMMDEAHSHPVVQDEIWLSDWGRRIAEFIPGMGDMIRDHSRKAHSGGHPAGADGGGRAESSC